MIGPDITLHYCISEVMAADIFTKHFVNRDKWESVCMLIGVVTSKHMSKLQHTKTSIYFPACVAVTQFAHMSGAASSSGLGVPVAQAMVDPVIAAADLRPATASAADAAIVAVPSTKVGGRETQVGQ